MSQPNFPEPGLILRKSPDDNIPRPGGRGDWTKKITDGKLFMRGPSPRFAWINIHDPDNEFDQPLTGISGTIVNKPHVSKSDLWFTHPFGSDFEFLVAPDAEYFDLVGQNMRGSYETATQSASSDFGLDVPGVIGMEMEEHLVPGEFRPHKGNRVCLWGRLIVDAGHGDFHTEIHPPLLMASASPARSKQQGAKGSADATEVKITTRPFLVSQKFDHGNLFNHMLVQLGEALNPFSTIDAHPELVKLPFAGLNMIGFEIRPPTPRRHVRDRLVLESTITRRTGSVAINVFQPGNEDALKVLIVLNDASYSPPPEPKKNGRSISLGDMLGVDDEIILAFAAIFSGPAVAVPTVAAVVAKGIKTHTYEHPRAHSAGHKGSFFRQPLDKAGGDIPTNRDDKQPFPLYGTIKLEWQRFLAPFPDSDSDAG